MVVNMEMGCEIPQTVSFAAEIKNLTTLLSDNSLTLPLVHPD
jgi:hypothetical protein